MTAKDGRDHASGERPHVRVTDRRHTAETEASPVAQADELAEARARAAEYLEHLQRLQAEFENYRKRTVKEQTRVLDFASETLVRRLLEVLDEFQLALASADAKPEFERFFRGFELVYAKLLDALRAEGLERLDAEGMPFDPERHEALLSSEEHDGEAYVADVLRPGYAMKGRVIRPAGVRVGRRPAGAGDAASGGGDAEDA